MNGEHKVGSGAMPARALLTVKDFCAALGGISERKFAALRADGIVPAPLELGPRIARWTPADVAAVVEKLPRREPQRAEPQTLAQGRRARIEAMKAAQRPTKNAP